LPALGMAQDNGKLIAWLKGDGEPVVQGEPLVEIESDKATVEIEAPASGILGVCANPGDVVPVGQAIAWILAPGEAMPEQGPPDLASRVADSDAQKTALPASPVARRLAEKHGLDLAQVRASRGRIRKDDVLRHIQAHKAGDGAARLSPASPKARQMAREQGLDVQSLQGSGPGGAVLAADVQAEAIKTAPGPQSIEPSAIWQVMAKRVTQSWTSAPHFYLLREVNASRLIAWRERAQERTETRLTYSDLLVKLVAAALGQHARVNASWVDAKIVLNPEINVGLAVAVERGLVVPVIHRADKLGLSQIAARRQHLVGRAQASKLSPDDLSQGTFTISNLGMYGVDVFNAIVNPPQAAILAVGRIAERVVPVNSQPAVQPMMILSLSCDHRVIDGARGAQFLETLADLIEEPLLLLVKEVSH